MIRPYLAKMTESEIHCIMTSGFACIAGSLFAAYISFGVSVVRCDEVNMCLQGKPRLHSLRYRHVGAALAGRKQNVLAGDGGKSREASGGLGTASKVRNAPLFDRKHYLQ